VQEYIKTRQAGAGISAVCSGAVKVVAAHEASANEGEFRSKPAIVVGRPA